MCGGLNTTVLGCAKLRQPIKISTSVSICGHVCNTVKGISLEVDGKFGEGEELGHIA